MKPGYNSKLCAIQPIPGQNGVRMGDCRKLEYGLIKKKQLCVNKPSTFCLRLLLLPDFL